MMTTLDRRHGERARIPCKIPVELTDERHTAPFEADAVDLSVGGLSLRAARLPEVGKYLLCNFESMPGGAHVLGRGEVVWAQPCGESGGEFGLRFVGIDPQTQALIDEMVAERIARIDTPFAGASPVIANLEIENVETPVAATFVRSGDGEALFEQPLDLLALGKSVVAHAGVSLVRGSIARVDLRMDGDIPMLALTVRLKPDAAEFGEFDWGGDSGPDTEPDLFAPQVLANAPAPQPESSSASLARTRAHDQMSLVFRHEPAEQPPAAEDERLRLDLSFDVDPGPESDARYGMLLTAADGGEPFLPEHAAVIESEDWAHPVPDGLGKSPLVRILRIFAALLAGFQRIVARAVQAVAALRGRASQRIVSGTSRMVAQARPRRTTARVVQRGPEGRGTLRLLGLGLMSIAAVALFAYALAPVGREDFQLHRRVNPEPAEIAPAGLAQPRAEAESSGSTVPAAANNQSVQPVQAAPGATPSAAAVPAGSPYALDIRGAAAAQKPKAVVVGSAFGQKQVPNPKRFLLRMSAPIKSVQGSSDARGFSVVIPGSLALERAAPIASGHPAVARAMIINRGDRSELSVRFADGKSPAYRVSGQGAALEVLIGL
jgi:hypothetical protein